MVYKLNNIEFYLGALPVEKKDHARTLDVIIYNDANGNEKLKIFNIKSNFSNYMPRYENGIIKDDCVSYDKNEDRFFGKLRGSLIGIPKEFKKSHYEFYSLDNNKNVHKTSIDFEFSSLKNMIKFNVVYDNKIRVKIDTDGHYIMSGVSANGNLLYKKGKLINEEDSTLYLDKDMPIKIYISKNLDRLRRKLIQIDSIL